MFLTLCLPYSLHCYSPKDTVKEYGPTCHPVGHILQKVPIFCHLKPNYQFIVLLFTYLIKSLMGWSKANCRMETSFCTEKVEIRIVWIGKEGKIKWGQDLSHCQCWVPWRFSPKVPAYWSDTSLMTSEISLSFQYWHSFNIDIPQRKLHPCPKIWRIRRTSLAFWILQISFFLCLKVAINNARLNR